MNETIKSRLERLGVALTPQPAPKHSYAAAVADGDVLYLSGKVAMRDGAIAVSGRLETAEDVDRGREAARICAVNLLSELDQAVGLENVKGLLKLTGYVASGPDFFQQPQVVNAASELMLEVLGEAGTHARSAVGVASLPSNTSVELDLVAKIGGGGR